LDGADVDFNDLSDGGLLLTGRDALAAVIAKLSSNRELLWVRRFKTQLNFASIAQAIELRDGRFAATGIIAPSYGGFGESDSDAILLISDADGNYLTQFGNCLVADGSLASALHELARRYGATINLYELMGLGVRTQASRSSRLPRYVSPNRNCEENVEARLLQLLEILLNQPAVKEGVLIPDIAYLMLSPLHPFLLHGRTSMYGPSPSESRMVPQIAIDVSLSEEMVKILAEELAEALSEDVVPFLSEITSTHQWLEEQTGFFFQNGDADVRSRNPIAFGQEYPLAPEDIARAAQILESSFTALNESEKEALRHYAGWFTAVKILDAPGDIREEGRRRMYLPASEAGRFWQWILDKTGPHEKMIVAHVNELKSRLGITVKGRPPRKPDQYREFLEQLVGELESVPDGNMMITMEFSTNEMNMHLLSLWRDDSRLGLASSDMSVQKAAKWLMSIPPP
jgi:hypothetical protein